MPRQLDLTAACEAFVAVAARDSFTIGATGAGLTQSVASRRIAALEQHLGARLFERTSRRVRLTPFGRRMLPNAIRLVDAAQALADAAADAHDLPVVVAVPARVAPRNAARVIAAAAGAGMTIEFLEGPPSERAASLDDGRALLALQHVGPDRATWTGPLGVGWSRPEAAGTLEPAAAARAAVRSGAEAGGRPFHLAELRPRRGGSGRRLLWLQPEDDVPSVRAPLERLRNDAGLEAGNLRTAESQVAAMARAIAEGDLVLCTPVEAAAYDLAWHPIGGLPLTRGYALLGSDAELAARFTDAAGDLVAELLGTSGDR
ncbi:helix-turn-helix domain-containing protein [Agromyces agglutinans]|uniref:helix-turn-helix domain-containing protein n=1 Tax=Agromyces agglutinans TaxID=2662258 RepID=UPI001299858B|nr:LysR family transcriptional regulator [Agromyces agglutinans]